MIALDDMNDLGEAIDSGVPVLMFVWREECEECPELLRRLNRMLRAYPPLTSYSLLLDEHPTAAGRFGVFNPPAVILYNGRNMILKQVQSIDFAALKRALDRVYTK